MTATLLALTFTLAQPAPSPQPMAPSTQPLTQAWCPGPADTPTVLPKGCPAPFDLYAHGPPGRGAAPDTAAWLILAATSVLSTHVACEEAECDQWAEVGAAVGRLVAMAVTAWALK